MKERNWERFLEWVKGYERERLKDKTPLQRIEIFEALYQVALTLLIHRVNIVSHFHLELYQLKLFLD